jgi:NAD(P)-dependent dehydrogenase (short-subunit alcohol dehydrogenase family)
MDPAVYTLVTGASSGIGRAVAVRLSHGRGLILHGRDVGRLEETRRLCEEPDRHVVWSFDLANIGGLTASLAPLLGEAGRAVEAFVHCAGVAPVLAARSVDYRAMQATLNVNFCSAAEITAVLLKKKTNAQKLRHIVFVSSIFSRYGARGHSAYCASKAALDGYMRALAVELAPDVRVNSILPGAVDTPMSVEGLADPEIVAKLARDYPLGVGRPDDIADAIEFLLSGKARWLTGQEIFIDGGRTANMSLK